jgi:hypothetical protein
MHRRPMTPSRTGDASGWRAKLDDETRARICRSCKALSAWGRIVRLARAANQGSWHRGPPERAGKMWPSGMGPSAQVLGLEAAAAGWENVRRGFLHTLTIADANLLELFDEDHRVGSYHEEQLEVWKGLAIPGLTYAQYLREHVGRGPGVTFMPTPTHRREDYAIGFKRGRLVLPAMYPPAVKHEIILHSLQQLDEDDVARGQPKDDKLKHRVIFVADDRNIYVAVKKREVIQHSSFLAGRPALISGYLTLRDYRASDNSFKITKIKGKSGHYRPNLEQFVVFLWAIELLIELEGVIGSYAVLTAAGAKDMVKRDAAELLDENRGRVIPANAPDELRFQLELGDEAPAPSPRPASPRPASPRPASPQQQQQQQRLPALTPHLDGEPEVPVDEAEAPPGAPRRRVRLCGCCQCTIQ